LAVKWHCSFVFHRVTPLTKDLSTPLHDSRRRPEAPAAFPDSKHARHSQAGYNSHAPCGNNQGCPQHAVCF
jgi:hypothetical protein